MNNRQALAAQRRELCAFLDSQTLPTKEDWSDKFISVLDRKPGQRLPDDIPTLQDYQAQHRNKVKLYTDTIKRYYAALKAGSTNIWSTEA